jgi:nucleoid-associated protein YgaU
MTTSGRALLIVLVVAAGLAGFVASRFVAPPPATPPEAPRPAASVAPAAPASVPPGPAPAAAAAAPEPPEAAGPEPPRFDVARVGARGVAVVAGRAAPGAEVVLMDDGREIGRARADSRGEWVILPAEPLRPGTRQLTLMARLGGTDTHGPDVVVVLVPEPAPLLAEASRQAGAPPPEPRPPAPAPRQAAPGPARADPVPAVPPAAAQPGPAPEAAAPARSVPAAPMPSAVAEAPAAAVEDAAAARRAEASLPPVPSQPLVVLLPASQAVPRVLQGQSPQQALALGQVDYDEAGAIRFAGTASPGATVRIYVNDQHTGDAQADQQGRWALAPGERVAVGRHRLRLDQLAAAGAVAARIEVPFQRDSLAEESVAGGRVVVQPGHNLWRLARAAYGRGVRYTVIYDANREQIRNPNMIFPGQVFAMPGMPEPPSAQPDRRR